MKTTLQKTLIVTLALVLMLVSFLPGRNASAASLLPVVSCPGALPTQLAVGKRAVVSTNVNFLGIRSSAVLDYRRQVTLYPGNTMTVLAGPYCASKSYFWYVVTKKGSGWVREGNLFYFIDPLP